MEHVGQPPRDRAGQSSPLGDWLSRVARAVDNLIATRWTFPVTRASAPTSLNSQSSLVLVSASGGDVPIFLPTAESSKDRYFTIKKIDSAVNLVRVKASGGQLIDGAETLDIATQYESVSIVSDGRNWWAI